MTATESTAGTPAPGWYGDPAGSGGLRYWDGHAWTGHVTPPRGTAFASVPPPSLEPRVPHRRVWPWFTLIGLLFLAGIVTAAVMLVPRAVSAGARVTDIAAQTNAKSGLKAARTIRSIEGSYVWATPRSLSSYEPDITFTKDLSPDFQTASIFAAENEFTIAVQSLSGRCYVIADRDGIEQVGRMLPGRPCLAAAASGGFVPDGF